MCFSAGASFTAGVLLTFTGVETLKKVHKPSQLVLGAIPLFFALQQFVEGVLWITISRSGFFWAQTASTYMFVIMAQIIWPVVIPACMLLIENNRIRKNILYGMTSLGAVIALYNSYLLITRGIHAEISSRHMTYQSGYDDNFGWLALSLYLAVTVLPLFVSSVKKMYVLGIVMALSFVVSAVFYMQCLTSVWCFFAAVISFVIFYILRESHKQSQFDHVHKK